MNKYLSKYTLPYNITETESLILLADKANQQAQQAYHQAVAEYESQYGPLTFDQAECTGCWQWIASPWPWEMED